MGEQLRILIAEDHQLARQTIRQILSEEFSQMEFGEAEDGAEALEKARSGDWDLLILDLKMPVKSGFEVIRELKNGSNTLPVCVLSMHEKEYYWPFLRQEGVEDYVEKINISRELPQSIKKILAIH